MNYKPFVTTYTVILNNYDNLRVPAKRHWMVSYDASEETYLYFGDRPRRVFPWIPAPFPQLFDNPARNCRIPKCLPHLLMETDHSIYMDGAYRLLKSPTLAVRELLDNADIALFEHPGGHKSYHDERNFYQNLHGYVPDDVEATYQRYVAEGLPVTGQFFAGGVVIRRHNEAVERFNEIWFQEYARGTFNDQFGLYYAVVKSGVKVAIIPGVATMDREYFGYCLHANSGCGDNPQYEEENKIWSDRVDHIKRLAGLPLSR